MSDEQEQFQVWRRGVRACLIYNEGRDAKHHGSQAMFCGTQDFTLREGSGIRPLLLGQGLAQD
jgi:hypothetical protein